MARELKVSRQDLPPQNLEAEESVLGAMMISQNAIIAVIDKLRQEDFYRDTQRLVYGAIIDLFNRGEPVDPITVAEYLNFKGVLDNVGGKNYIHTLVSTVPSAANAARYAGIVRENSVLRSLIEVGYRISEMGYERPGEVDEMLDRCEKMVFDISQHQVRGGFESIKELVDEHFDQLVQMLHQKGQKITGVPSGFSDLDSVTSGFQKSNLIILAARPSMGKTALALDIAQNAALKHDVPVAVFSLEMSKSELAQRMMCTQGKVNSHRLRTGMADENDWEKLKEGCSRLFKAPIYVDDSAGVNMLEIRAKTRRLISREKIGLVIVDYLQLMMPEGRTQNREQEVAKMSRQLKLMAKELEIPVLTLSQLSRAPEQRSPSRPVLSDLRESGAIEQDADLVLFIYRPKDEDTGHPGRVAELIISKNRNGPTRTVELAFREEYISFIGVEPKRGARA